MIRWIRPRLGTSPFDALGPIDDWHIVDVRHLVDRAGNPPQAIRDVIEAGVRAHASGRTVVVACDLGISRSNAVAAGIISRLDSVDLRTALAEVLERTGEREIKLEFVDNVQCALGDPERQVRPGALLVTGGTGFLGSHVLAVLQSERRVHAPTRRELDLADGAVALARYCAHHGIDQILHLACPRRHTNTAALGERLAILKTVLEACRSTGARLVFVSGAEVYRGYASAELLADESTPMRPAGIHSEAKYLEEILVDLHFQRGDVERSICRLSPVYGPGGDRPRFLRTFLEASRRRQPMRTHRYLNGPAALDLLFVSDAVDALRRVLAQSTCDVFHVGTGRLTRIADCARLIGDLAGGGVDIAEIAVDDHVANVAFPAGKARRLLGWSPQVSLREGLGRTFEIPGEARS